MQTIEVNLKSAEYEIIRITVMVIRWISITSNEYMNNLHPSADSSAYDAWVLPQYANLTVNITYCWQCRCSYTSIPLKV
eukprot:scaffold52750_cov22-Prasinocladus_malaysianus.AAC.1